MRMRKVNSVDLDHIIDDLAGDVDNVTIEPFAGNQVADEILIVNVRLDHLTARDSIFNVPDTDMADSTLVPCMTGETILVILNQLANTFRLNVGLVYTFRHYAAHYNCVRCIGQVDASVS